MKTIWKIFARQPSNSKNSEDYAAECYKAGLIAIGWNEVGPLKKFDSPEVLKKVMAKVWADETRGKPGKLAQWAGSLWKFKESVTAGDIVLCPDRKSRSVYVGEVLSMHSYYDQSPFAGCIFAHRRKVKWYRQLTSEETRRVWKGGLFGGQQTVTRAKGDVNALLKIARRKKPRKPGLNGNIQWHPDKEWGDLAEKRAMEWLRKKGMKPISVAHLNRGWDIECGDDKFEVKGRKSGNTLIRLTANEWRAANELKKRFTILLFTAPTEAKLRRATPRKIPDPANTEDWMRKVSFEYFLNE